MALTGKLSYLLHAALSSTRDLGAASVMESLSYSQAITDGDGANQAERVWGDTRALAISTAEELDLAGGLTDGLGNTIVFNEIRALGIQAAASNGSTLTVGGAAANAWEAWCAGSGDAVKLVPGGSLILIAPNADGYAVAAGTGDLLKVGNDDGAAAASYSIFILGSQA